MTIAPFVAVSLLFGCIALVAQPRSATAWFASLGGLAVVSVSAALLPIGVRDASLGGVPVLVDAFVRLFLALAAICGLLLLLVEAAAPLPGAPAVPAVSAVAALPAEGPLEAPQLVGAGFLLFVAAAAVTLAAAEPIPAVAAASAAGLAALVAAARLASRIPDPRPTARDLGAVRPVPTRALAGRLGADASRVAAAYLAAVAGIGLLIGGRDAIAGDPLGIGLVALVLAGAAGLRLGVVPFHAHAARLAESPLRGLVPLLCAWSPGLFGLVVLGGAEAAVQPVGLALPVERGVVAVVALATVGVAGLAAFVQDDLEHVLAYSILQDLALLLLAFAATDLAAWSDARTWLVVAAVAKSALVGWGIALVRTFRSRSLATLGGWARRSPFLGLTALVVTLATVGIPGFEGFDARAELARLALPEPAAGLALVLPLATLAVHVRLLGVGLRAQTPIVSGSAVERLERPSPDPRRRASRTARESLELNRPILAATCAAAMALVAFSAGTGLFGIRAAAAEHAPASLPGAQPTQAPDATFQPVTTNQP